MKRQKRTVVSAVIVSQDGKVLLGKGREGAVYPGCWLIPGGGVDEGESLKEALIREVKEEVGIDISNMELELVSDSDSDVTQKTNINTGEQFEVEMQFHTYRVNLNEPSDVIKISLDDDLIEAKWVSIQKLSTYMHSPPSVRLFKKLGWLG